MGLLCVPIWVASLVSIFSSCRSLYQNFTAFWANAIPLHAYITYILYPSAFCVCTYAGTYTTVHVHFWRPESHKSPSFSLWVPGICTCIPRLAASAGWAEPFHQFYFPRCCFEPGSHLTNAGLRLMFSAGAELLPLAIAPFCTPTCSGGEHPCFHTIKYINETHQSWEWWCISVICIGYLRQKDC